MRTRPALRGRGNRTDGVRADLSDLAGHCSASFTPEQRAVRRTPRCCRERLVLDHYRALFDERDFWTPIRNSLVVGVPHDGDVAGGRRAVRLRPRAPAVPGTRRRARVRARRLDVPADLDRARRSTLLLRALRLLNTYPGLVLPYLTFAMPLTIWLLIGFFRQLPPELEEAALLDGAGRLRIALGDRPAAVVAGPRDDRHPHVPLQLERVPVRALVHARPGAAHRAGGHRAVSRAVPGAVGPGPGGGGRRDRCRWRSSCSWRSGASSPA